MDTKIFGEHDQRVIDQLDRCVAQEEGSRGVLCADGHLGYSAPIGGVVAYREHVSPAAVGYDIGCGNLAVRTDLHEEEIALDLPGLMDRVFSEVSFGVGRRDGRAADHLVIDAIREADFEPQRALAADAAKQLGTVGAGNHYVDLLADEDGSVWVGVHFGSRGFGNRTASGFLALARGLPFSGRAPQGEMEAPPDVLPVRSDLGQSYLAAMELAGAYAHAGREVVVDQVLGILGARALDSVHNHHNYAWFEEQGGEDLYVVRKGATPAFPGQRGFVGATMGEPAVILQGVDTPRAAEALRSTVHGAGRAMSRTAAAGRQRKRWACARRGCGWTQPPRTHKPEAARCPVCGGGLTKRWVQDFPGAIDWEAARREIRERGIELRGAAADEAPGAYKRLSDVLAAHEGTVEVLHELRPLGVAMAGPETPDPWKD